MSPAAAILMVEAGIGLGSVDPMSASENGAPFEELVAHAEEGRRSAARGGKVPYLLAGGLAIWARGGPERDHDLDFLVKPDDAERALEALVDAGMKPERPPEDWLLKAYDENGVLVDLIFRPSEMPVTDEMIGRGDELEVKAIKVNVVSAGDVLVSKLLALREHELDYDPLVEMTRAVREQIDWADVRERARSTRRSLARSSRSRRGSTWSSPSAPTLRLSLKSASSELKTPVFGGAWPGARVILQRLAGLVVVHRRLRTEDRPCRRELRVQERPGALDRVRRDRRRAGRRRRGRSPRSSGPSYLRLQGLDVLLERLDLACQRFHGRPGRRSGRRHRHGHQRDERGDEYPLHRYTS